MRGDGDMAMSENTNIQLLEKIIRNQRRIIEKERGKKASEVPQVWALYKEVMDYYDAGLRVPDDVTLLLCDDNWATYVVCLRQKSENAKADGDSTIMSTMWGLRETRSGST